MLDKLQQWISRTPGPSFSFTLLWVLFRRASTIWNSLSAKYFPLTFLLNGYKNRDISFLWALFKQLFYTIFFLIMFFLQLHTSMVIMAIWWKLHLTVLSIWDNQTCTTRVGGRRTNHWDAKLTRFYNVHQE